MQATPIFANQKGRDSISVQGGVLQKGLELKCDLTLKYMGVGICVNHHIALFSSRADSLSLPFINTVAGIFQ